MSGWDGGEIVRWAPRSFDDCPGWVALDCGCCNGICWGGEEPVECYECGNSGWRYIHAASGVLAEYPKGPLCGRADPSEIKEARMFLDVEPAA